jgi:hypothetical protein
MPKETPINARLVKDLCKKANDDAFMVIDRNMDLAAVAADDDIELEGFIKNSILASVATNIVGASLDFLYSSHDNPGGKVEELNIDQFKDLLAQHLARVGRVLIEGHIKRRQRAKQ